MTELEIIKQIGTRRCSHGYIYPIYEWRVKPEK
jgi:hypothetical protein